MSAPRDLISDEYRALLRKMRETKPDFGTYGYKHASNVAEVAERVGAKSILDYGSGGGSLARALRTLTMCEVHVYDPAFHDDMPTPCDLVTCTDVLEHVEPDKLDAVLSHIFELARVAAYIAIFNGPAKAVLPDGRNAHLIIESPHWWMERLSHYHWGALSPALYRPDNDVIFWLRKEKSNVAAAA